MVVTFEYAYLRELYEAGNTSDRKHRFQPDIVKCYRRRIDTLVAASSPETLYQFNSLNFEALTGDKAGRFSIRVNNKYRIEFTISEEADRPLISICNILELSNHYD